MTVLGYAVLSALGWLRDFLRHIGLEKKKTAHDPNPKVRLDLCTVESSTRRISLLSVLCHSTKVMNASILVIYTREYVMSSINRLPVWREPKFK